MATKKTTKAPFRGGDARKSTKSKAAKPAKPAKKAGTPKVHREKAPPGKVVARHPMGRIKERHGSKADLVKTLVDPLAAGDESTDALRARLNKASNQQLLRLARVVSTVQEKYGSRDKLIESIGKAQHKTKDDPYLAKLATFSLPRLLDLATSTERRAKA